MNCKQCKSTFEVTDRDREFYAKMGVPEPTHCPDCRRQRRLAWRNERHLYRRQCAACKKSIISCYSSDKLLTVYCRECWWSDQMDPFVYGRDFDFSRPFFEQFAELEKSVPHFALFQDGNSENCEYTNYGMNNKSCYMSVCAFAEDIYYGWAGLRSKSCADITKIDQCEECYECVDCSSSTRLLFSQNCYQCHDSAFLINCDNVKNCFGSINLKHKEYVFLNKQLTKEEYENKIKHLKLDAAKIEEMLEFMKNISAKSIHRASIGSNNENSMGNYLNNTKNCYQCFDVLEAQDCAYCDFGGLASDMWDCSNAGYKTSLLYECNGVSLFNRVGFHLYGRNCHDSFYNHYCFSAHHLFGCVGIKQGEYIILNKKYSKEDYENLSSKIIDHMKQTGEWGEFFPIKFSPYSYNETLAYDYFPLSKEAVTEHSWQWQEEEKNPIRKEETDMIKNCHQCQRSYLIIEQEKKFYDKFQLPLPQNCPECRHQRRFKCRNPFRLYERICAKCQKPIQTSYAPDRPESVYCEECYLKEIY